LVTLVGTGTYAGGLTYSGTTDSTGSVTIPFTAGPSIAGTYTVTVTRDHYLTATATGQAYCGGFSGFPGQTGYGALADDHARIGLGHDPARWISAHCEADFPATITATLATYAPSSWGYTPPAGFFAAHTLTRDMTAVTLTYRSGCITVGTDSMVITASSFSGQGPGHTCEARGASVSVYYLYNSVDCNGADPAMGGYSGAAGVGPVGGITAYADACITSLNLLGIANRTVFGGSVSGDFTVALTP